MPKLVGYKKGFTLLEFREPRGKSRKNKPLTGFTIIELLVIVAIIAILASIILVNVAIYTNNKDRNAAIKNNLSSALTNAEVFYYKNGTYTAYCTSDSYIPIRDAVNSIIGAIPTCVGITVNWCGCSTLKVTANEPIGSTFCVDSTGYKKVTQDTFCSARCSGSGVCSD